MKVNLAAYVEAARHGGVPFEAIPVGGRFYFPGDKCASCPEPHTKLRGGWFSDVGGQKWRTGPGTTVVPVTEEGTR